MNTVTGEAKGVYKVSGSRFVAVIFPAMSKIQIDKRRNDFKSEHASATHICYAYRLSEPEVVFSTDAGEPKGTAGKPLLNMLLKHHLTNTAILVARYYGGKKLGVPGLIAAYTAAGEAALMNAEQKEFIPVKRVELWVPFCRINDVYILAKKHKAEVSLIEIGDPVQLILTLEVKIFESFENELRNNHLLHNS